MGATWSPAVPGQATSAGQINQFLSVHQASLVYAGTLLNSETISGSPAADELGTTKGIAYRFQSPATVTQLSRVSVAMGAMGGGVDVLMTLQGDTGAGPDGNILASCIIPAAWLSSGIQSVPTPVHGFPLSYMMSALTFYNVVFEPVGSFTPSGTYSPCDVEITRSTSTSGALTFNGTSWIGHSYGYGVNLYGGSTGVLNCVSEDNDALLKCYDYDPTSGLMSTVREWAAKSVSAPLNLLTVDDACMSNSIGNWQPGANLAHVSSPLVAGASGSLRLTVPTAVSSFNVYTQNAQYEVNAGQIYSATVSVSCNGGTPRNAKLAISWYDSSNTYISTSISGAAVIEPATGFVAAVVQNVVAPSTAAYCSLVLTIYAATGNLAVSELHFVSAAGLFASSATQWSAPGSGISSQRSLTFTNGLLTAVT